MEPHAMISSNLDTCRHGHPTYLINGLRTLGGRSGGWGEQAMANTNTHTYIVSLVIHRVVEPRAMIRSNHDTCRHGPPANQTNGL